MNNEHTLKKFEEIAAIWEQEIAHYSLEELLKKPSEDAWSMGQLYNHLVTSGLNFHLKQVETCITSNENAKKNKNFKSFITYNILGKLPPVKVKVPPSDAYTPKQPKNKQEILDGLVQIQQKMKETLPLLKNAKFRGKTAHPALGFLNAAQWYKLVEMHFNHHLMQKKNLDAFLNK